MTAFNNRFWGVRRLKHAMPDVTDLRVQVEPYLSWRLLALEATGILLCNPATAVHTPHADDLIIIEGVLMYTWLEYRAAGASSIQ